MSTVMECPATFPRNTGAVQADLAGRLRIAHVQLLPLLSGVQRVSLDELTRLDRQRYEPYLICQSPGPLTEAAEACGITCLFADRLVRPIAPWSDLRALVQLYQLMRQHRFDIVHTHSSKTGILGRMAARAAGVPAIIHTVHGFAFSATSSRIQKAFYFAMEWVGARLCNRIVCLNHADRDFARLWLRVAPDRLSRIPNGVNANLYCPPDERRRAASRAEVLGLRDGEFGVGMVARLSPQKNPLCFVEVAARVLARGIPGRFFLIGDGELRPRVQAEIRRRGLEGKVVLLGWRDDLPRVLGALDLFVLTSGWEGYPLAILEALACGVPVIASDIPGSREALTEEIDGLLVSNGDSRAFAAAIVSLLDSAALRRQFAQAGRQIITARHDLDLRVARMEELYTRMAAPVDA